MESATGTAALRYLDLGHHVMPCHEGEKTPATKSGYKSATTDVDRVTQWWTERPDMNVAIATGLSGLVVIDLDVKNDINGIENWLDFATKHSGVPLDLPTFEVETPSGGAHLYYRLPRNAAEVKGSASKVAPGVDVRAAGGYIVAPPSLVNGKTYNVTDDRPIAELPEWLHKLLLPAPQVFDRTSRRSGKGGAWNERHDEDGRHRSALSGFGQEVQRVYNAPTGTRNNALNLAAHNLFQLVAGGLLNEHMVTAQLTSAALAVGLTLEETQKTIASGRSAGEKNPRR